MHAPNDVRPLGLQRSAAAIAASYGDKGAVVVTYGPEGVRLGAAGMDATELREALAVAIHYSFVFEGEST